MSNNQAPATAQPTNAPTTVDASNQAGSQPTDKFAAFRALIEEMFADANMDRRYTEGKINAARRDLMRATLATLDEQRATILGQNVRIEGLTSSRTDAWDLQRDSRAAVAKYRRALEAAIKAITTTNILTRLTSLEMADVEGFFDPAIGSDETARLVIAFKLGEFDYQLIPGDNMMIVSAGGIEPMTFFTDYLGRFNAKELFALQGLFGVTNEHVQHVMEHTMPSDVLAKLFADNDPTAGGIANLFANLTGGDIPRNNANPMADLFSQMGITDLDDLPGHENGTPSVQVFDVTKLMQQGGLDAVMNMVTGLIANAHRKQG
jgi:hypothetical protein